MQGQLSNRLREHDAELAQPLNHHESLLYMQIIFSRCPPLSLSLSLSIPLQVAIWPMSYSHYSPGPSGHQIALTLRIAQPR